MSNGVSMKEVAQQALANRIFHEPGFLEQLYTNPTDAAKPVLQALLGSDERVDLSDVRIEVHFETDDVIHLVIPVESARQEGDEVAGFVMEQAPLRFGALSFDTMRTHMSDTHGCPACPHPCTGPNFYDDSRG